MSKYPEFDKIPWEHAGSRYQCVTTGLIDELQAAFFKGQELWWTFSHLEREKAWLITAESLRADCTIKRFYKASLLRYKLDKDIKTKLTDFELAAIAEIMMEIADLAYEESNRKDGDMWLGSAYSLLELAVNSPIASPMLWYEDIFIELAEAIMDTNPQKALHFLKRGLAHDLRYNEGDNVSSLLQDIADWHLKQNKFERGLQIFISLLHRMPDDIWVYNGLALACEDVHLYEISAWAAQRGLELIKAKGDDERLSSQLRRILEETQSQKTTATAKLIPPATLEKVQAALSLDFDTATSTPLDLFCHDLVPDLDSVPVKRPMTYFDLPLPDRNLILKELLEPLPEPEEIVGEMLATDRTKTPKKKRHKKRRKH